MTTAGQSIDCKAAGKLVCIVPLTQSTDLRSSNHNSVIALNNRFCVICKIMTQISICITRCVIQ